MLESQVIVVGGGLAGSECALQLARRGVKVALYEQRPVHSTAAHHTDKFAELVCSNSLKSQKVESAAGLLKEELTRMGSYLIGFARQAAVDAGGALAVDRDVFSGLVTEAIEANENIEVVHEEVTQIPSGPCVIAAGPLCSDALAAEISKLVGSESLSFFDAAAPVVDAETLDMDVIFSQSRYEKDAKGDYLNCPMNKEEYETFISELLAAKRTISKDFEQKDLFCACQPIEEVARTGKDSVRFGALKPVGLTDPRTGHRPWAVVQLRAENKECTAYNLVGFQTNLAWGEQKRVFRLIPGLENADFFRYGVMHRNSFIDAPRTFTNTFALPNSTVRFAGQICGTEGYVEAIASGLLAALNTYADISGKQSVVLPATSAFGSLVAYATNPETSPYQPMHVNFGIIPPLDGPRLKKQERYAAYSARALKDLDAFIASREDIFNVH